MNFKQCSRCNKNNIFNDDLFCDDCIDDLENIFIKILKDGFKDKFTDRELSVVESLLTRYGLPECGKDIFIYEEDWE